MKRPLVVLLLALAACGHPPSNGTGPGTGAAGAADAAAAPSTADAGPPEKVVQINEPGAMVNVEASFVPGYVMIVDFWAEWCGACEKVDEAIMAAVADEPRILVRKVHVGDGDTQVAEQPSSGSVLPSSQSSVPSTMKLPHNMNGAASTSSPASGGPESLPLQAVRASARHSASDPRANIGGLLLELRRHYTSLRIW